MQTQIKDKKVYANQFFPVFEAISENFLFYKPRELVHTQGDWHKGIQAHIIRKNGDSFDILVQNRSKHVDIGKNKLDQSLATQMIREDGLSEDISLQRGLYEELGIKNYLAKTRLNTNLRIIKTYEDDATKINREIISLYIITLDKGMKIIPRSKKIQQVFWMPWEKFLSLSESNPTRFTKTAQFYLRNKKLQKEITRISKKLIEQIPDTEEPPLQKNVFFHTHHRNASPNTIVTTTTKWESLSENKRQHHLTSEEFLIISLFSQLSIE